LSDFEWLCFVYVSIDDDPAVARAKALDFIGRGQAGDGARFERLVERVAACGDPDRVAEALQSYVDAGVRHLVLLCCERHDQGAAMRRLMNDVVPRVDVARAEV
jgi:alkanesulfonate monooxygenase SsuD/methylene tetrahydromethanopterin reductase-like flavin-dependent oxidoreductase (luciferase family)